MEKFPSNLHSSRYIANLNFELSKLYKKYYILEPEISISIPEEVELHNKSERTKVIKSEVILNLSSISDKHIFISTVYSKSARLCYDQISYFK